MALDLQKHMVIAKAIAELSKDPSTKVGALIIGVDREPISWGYNGFPRGYDDSDPKNFERPLKYELTSHAEQNAIYNAARIGVSTKGATIFVTSLPTCIDCSKAIIQAGIVTVVMEAKSFELTGEKKTLGVKTEKKDWTNNWELREGLYRQCGVTLITI